MSSGAAGIWILNNASSGLINVESGTLIPWIQSGENSGGTFDVAVGATLQFGATATFTGTYTGSGGGQFVLGSGQLNIGSWRCKLRFPHRFLPMANRRNY